MTGDPPEDLTDTESAQYSAARAAAGDLRGALESGEDNDQQAAAAALAQAIAQLNPTTTRDKMHIPDDAEEYEPALRTVLGRIPDGWGRWISCDRGWFPIVADLDRQLADIDPDYQLHQVKEKFGELRFYFRASGNIDEDARTRMRELVAEAESRCTATCEACGTPNATLCVGRYRWYKTVCPLCAATHGYEPLDEAVEELTPSRWYGTWSVSTAEGTQVWDLNRGEIRWEGDVVVYSAPEILAPPRVGGFARVLLPDGTEQVSGLITQIRRIG